MESELLRQIQAGAKLRKVQPNEKFYSNGCLTSISSTAVVDKHPPKEPKNNEDDEINRPSPKSDCLLQEIKHVLHARAPPSPPQPNETVKDHPNNELMHENGLLLSKDSNKTTIYCMTTTTPNTTESLTTTESKENNKMDNNVRGLLPMTPPPSPPDSVIAELEDIQKEQLQQRPTFPPPPPPLPPSLAATTSSTTNIPPPPPPPPPLAVERSIQQQTRSSALASFMKKTGEEQANHNNKGSESLPKAWVDLKVDVTNTEDENYEKQAPASSFSPPPPPLPKSCPPPTDNFSPKSCPPPSLPTNEPKQELENGVRSQISSNQHQTKHSALEPRGKSANISSTFSSYPVTNQVRSITATSFKAKKEDNKPDNPQLTLRKTKAAWMEKDKEDRAKGIVINQKSLLNVGRDGVLSKTVKDNERKFPDEGSSSTSSTLNSAPTPVSSLYTNSAVFHQATASPKLQISSKISQFRKQFEVAATEAPPLSQKPFVGKSFASARSNNLLNSTRQQTLSSTTTPKEPVSTECGTRFPLQAEETVAEGELKFVKVQDEVYIQVPREKTTSVPWIYKRKEGNCKVLEGHEAVRENLEGSLQRGIDKRRQKAEEEENGDGVASLSSSVSNSSADLSKMLAGTEYAAIFKDKVISMDMLDQKTIQNLQLILNNKHKISN